MPYGEQNKSTAAEESMFGMIGWRPFGGHNRKDSGI